MAIIRVWIEEGCIVCNACEAECPEVFHVTEDSCHIRAEARVDGKASENRAEKSPLKAELQASLEMKILAAAASCPTGVIITEQPAAQVEAPATAAETKAGIAKEIEAAVEAAIPLAAPVKDEAPKAPPAPAAAKPEAAEVPKAPAPVAAKPEAPPPVPAPEPEAPSGPYVYDYAASPLRQIVPPKTAPVPSLKAYQAEVAAAAAADEAKWKKQQSDYEAAKAKAEAEGKDAPKPPVRPVPRKDDNDVKTPWPTEAKDPDLLRLQELLGDKVEEVFEQAGELTCQVKKESILEVLMLCRDDESLGYELLADQTATHYPVAKDFAYSVVYQLTSVARRKHLRIRILIPEGFTPDSAFPAYPTANWLEREIFDMLGIRFTAHPDMTRILCPEDWEGWPLRKDYPVVGLGQRDIDFRDDRGGMLMRLAMEKAGHMGINLKVPKAE